jgi:hypothetical protein
LFDWAVSPPPQPDNNNNNDSIMRIFVMTISIRK